MLEGGREDQPLAEMLRILVELEAGTERCDLEQHADRLAEVDRAEPETVDHGRRPSAGGAHAVDPAGVLVGRRRPRDVVNRAGAADASLVRRRVVHVEATPRVAAAAPGR